MPDTPRRIQLRRIKGWRKPPGCVSCARPSKWGNHITVGGSITRELAVQIHRDDMEAAFRHRPHTRAALIAELRGRDLGCWCGLCPQHADGKPLGLACDACGPCHVETLMALAMSACRRARSWPTSRAATFPRQSGSLPAARCGCARISTDSLTPRPAAPHRPPA